MLTVARNARSRSLWHLDSVPAFQMKLDLTSKFIKPVLKFKAVQNSNWCPLGWHCIAFHYSLEPKLDPICKVLGWQHCPLDGSNWFVQVCLQVAGLCNVHIYWHTHSVSQHALHNAESVLVSLDWHLTIHISQCTLHKVYSKFHSGHCTIHIGKCTQWTFCISKFCISTDELELTLQGMSLWLPTMANLDVWSQLV